MFTKSLFHISQTAFSESHQWFYLCKAFEDWADFLRGLKLLHIVILNFIFTIFPKVYLNKYFMTRKKWGQLSLAMEKIYQFIFASILVNT